MDFSPSIDSIIIRGFQMDILTPPDGPSLDLARLELARKVISEHGDKIAPVIQKDILAQRVTLGMAPYDAHLAAGAYTFRVRADPVKWPKGCDPYKVIAAQSLRPDNSEIWMTFSNAQQFPEKGLTQFKVYVKGGKVLEIVEMNQPGKS